MALKKTRLQHALTSAPVRARLVRLCARLTGDYAAAEDLAQEALIEAWRHLDALQRPEMLTSWLAGIAANVCRRWHRRRAIESARNTTLDVAAGLSVASDAEGVFEQHELAALLERAMGCLSPLDREILVARYCENRNLAEIALCGGWTTNNAAVRLRRSRVALHRVLTTQMRHEASDFGLVDAVGPVWQQTRLWCFRCGRERLEGRFSARNAETGRGTHFAVRCPQCDAGPGDVAFSTAHSAMDTAQVIGPTRSYKPAFRRVITWWGERIERGLREGAWECWRCAGPMRLLTAPTPTDMTIPHWHQARFQCGRCDAEFSLPVSGFVFHSIAGQRFWQRYPRMRVAPERTILLSGQRAVIARYEDVTSTASLEVLYTADTFQPLKSWGDVPADVDS